MPFCKCPDCGREVDARAHNLRAHRRTHASNGSRPLKVAELFELPAAAPGEAREAVLPREEFRLG